MMRIALLLLVFSSSVFAVRGFGKSRIIARRSYPPNRSLKMKSEVNLDSRDTSLAAIVNSPVVSIGAGLGGMILVLVNRLGMDLESVTDIQSRADIIAVIGCSALLLNILSEQEITARNRDPVPLVGFALKDPLIADSVPTATKSALDWCIRAVLANTPVTSVHIISGDSVLARGGVIGSGDDRSSSALQNVAKMPILQKAMQLGEEVYLPDLQVNSGLIEHISSKWRLFIFQFYKFTLLNPYTNS
jgi:Cofactor assembly of complex C subunit B, CCB2/CCB4